MAVEANITFGKLAALPLGGGECDLPALFSTGDPARTCVAGCCALGINGSVCECRDDYRGALCDTQLLCSTAFYGEVGATLLTTDTTHLPYSYSYSYYLLLTAYSYYLLLTAYCLLLTAAH